MDDFLIGFDNEDAAHRALSALRNALWKFNLQLNEEKTSVSQTRLHFKERWKIHFDSIPLASNDSPKQEHDIYHLIDLTLHYCEEFETALPAHWACRRLSVLKVGNKNFGIILDALFRLARDFPSCTNQVAAFLINNQTMFSDLLFKKRAASWIKSTMRIHFPKAHDFEISWCLCASAVLKIPIDEKDVSASPSGPSSIVFAMLGLLRERELLSVPLSKWDWRARFKKGGVYGVDWLPYYEAVRRKWTKDKTIISAVNKDIVLKKMLAANVTFLEDQILDASRIDITRRVFKKDGKSHQANGGWSSINPVVLDYD